MSEDLAQCIIYDSPNRGARLIGIEYVISEKLFQQLSPDEQRLWHSHDYEVHAGLLTAPGMPEDAEKSLMKDLARTFGKTFHTWQVDRDPIPLGIPQLMMAYTGDGQVPPVWLQKRDQSEGISVERLRSTRASVSGPVAHGRADDWTSNAPLQLMLRQFDKA